MPNPIKHLVVLMLENRSFDHMLGFLPGVNGMDPSWTNPLTPEGPQVQVSPDARTVHDLNPDPGLLDNELADASAAIEAAAPDPCQAECPDPADVH